ncbi:hypothetical protein PGB90_008531 [Kerria lacca]
MASNSFFKNSMLSSWLTSPKSDRRTEDLVVVKLGATEFRFGSFGMAFNTSIVIFKTHYKHQAQKCIIKYNVTNTR